MADDLDTLTAFASIDPTRVDAVGTPANGIPFLILKQADPEELLKEFVDGLCEVSGCPTCHDRYQALNDTDGFVEKARLKAKERDALSDSDFAFPKQRKEPLPDAAHVRDAMARFEQVQGVSAEERKEAARRILARAKHFGIHVSEDTAVARAAKQTAPDKSVPEGEAESQTDEHIDGPEGPVGGPEAHDGGEPGHQSLGDVKPPMADGQGDTAPDKGVPTGEAESQTRELGKAGPPEDGTGDHLADGEHQTAGAEAAAEHQTEEIGKAGSADSDPGSSAWEHKDVELGERAEALTNELGEVVHEFTQREKAEGGASKSTRRALSRVRQLLENPAAIKEMARMTTSAAEALKMLDEADAARRAEKTAKKAQDKAFRKAVAKAAAKKAAKAAPKDDETTAKGAEAPEAAKSTTKLSKSDLRKQVEGLQGTVAKLAAQDGRRIPVNAAGVTAFLRNPETQESAFKAFEDAVGAAEADLAKAKEASNEYALAQARRDLLQAKNQLTAVKMIAGEHARTHDIEMVVRAQRGQGVPLLSNRHQLPDDNRLRAV